MVFENIVYGSYTVREKIAPIGYNLSLKTQEVNVTNNGVNRLEFTNAKIRGDISFKKNDESNNPLKGAEFTLYSSGDVDRKKPIANSISNEQGLVIFKGIEYGEYIIVETKAPEGYNLTNEILKVSIVNDGALVKPNKDTIINTMISGGFEIIKIDKDSKLPLKNASIAIYKEDGTFIEQKTTDGNGKVIFNDLTFGKYYFVEKIAPIGYVLNENKNEFEVIDNGQKKSVTFENTIIPKVPEVPEVPEEPENPKDPEEPYVPPYKPNEPNEPNKPLVPEPPQKPNTPLEPNEPTTPDEVEEFDDLDGENPQGKPEDNEVEDLDDINPQAKPEDEIEIIAGDNPQGKPTLPKTGSASPTMVYGLGGLLILIGSLLKRKNKKN